MTRRRINLLCQVMAKCSNRWSHLVSSSPSPQSSSFCKIVQKWRKSISYNCLVAVSFEYKNYGSGYEEILVEHIYGGFSFIKTSKLVTFGRGNAKCDQFLSIHYIYRLIWQQTPICFFNCPESTSKINLLSSWRTIKKKKIIIFFII